MRSEWLASIHVGVISVPDLIQAATEESGAPLRRISLRQLLLTQPGWSEAKVRAALDRITHLLDLKESTRRLTVAWLVDARTGGKRLRAWADVMQERVLPWTGFPYAPNPQGGDA